MTTQHEMTSAARLIAENARHTLEAREAGMPPASARRWPRYLAMKAEKGQQPISLAEAVDQCARVRA